jgi:diaminohydroxyphosphoribosylaminopyrimidine deaminase/5-amino-6-(5-phosphoribosylamino)uracil reductase
MNTREAEIAAMQRAVAISALGLGSTSPNPPVGCVILDRHGTPAGEGYHRRKSESQAEVNALAAAGSRAAGGTAVVTAEPSTITAAPFVPSGTHRRRHRAGPDRADRPTSRGECGAARLRAAGVKLEIGLLADEALVVLGPWWAR